MRKQPHITIIGQGFVGSAYKEFLRERAHITVWDSAFDKDYPNDKIAQSQLAMICVGTPQLKNGSCDISAVRKAIEELPKGPVVSIRSTIPPGTTRALVEEFQRPISFAPEYLGETGKEHAWGVNIEAIPHFIVGGDDEARRLTLETLQPLLSPNVQVFECDSTEAETIKLMENAFLATKVAFINEIYDYCQTLGVDWLKVREGWLLDPRIGDSHTQVYSDRRGFGGSCLPKDLNSLIYEMEQHALLPLLMRGVRESNAKARNVEYRN